MKVSLVSCEGRFHSPLKSSDNSRVPAEVQNLFGFPLRSAWHPSPPASRLQVCASMLSVKTFLRTLRLSPTALCRHILTCRILTCAEVRRGRWCLSQGRPCTPRGSGSLNLCSSTKSSAGKSRPPLFVNRTPVLLQQGAPWNTLTHLAPDTFLLVKVVLTCVSLRWDLTNSKLSLRTEPGSQWTHPHPGRLVAQCHCSWEQCWAL